MTKIQRILYPAAVVQASCVYNTAAAENKSEHPNFGDRFECRPGQSFLGFQWNQKQERHTLEKCMTNRLLNITFVVRMTFRGSV